MYVQIPTVVQVRVTTAGEGGGRAAVWVVFAWPPPPRPTGDALRRRMGDRIG